MQPQPLRVPEEPRVGEFAGREVEGELVVGDVEVAAEVGEVLRQDRRDPVGHHRDPDVAAGDDLEREAADHAAELRGEHRPADAAHERARARDELLHLLGRLLVEHRGESAGDRVGDRLGELLPHRQRLLDPLAAGDRERGCGELGDRRRLAQPQSRQGECLIELGAVAGGDAEPVAIGEVQRLRLRRAPVDAVPGAARTLALREGGLHLPHDLLQHRGVDAHAGESLELRRVDSRAAGTSRAPEQVPQELLEFVLAEAVVVVVVSHVRRLSAGGSRRALR